MVVQPTLAKRVWRPRVGGWFRNQPLVTWRRVWGLGVGCTTNLATKLQRLGVGGWFQPPAKALLGKGWGVGGWFQPPAKALVGKGWGLGGWL